MLDSSKKNKYNPSQDYSESASNFQTVPSHEQYGVRHPDVNVKDYDSNRAETFYSCADSYQMASIRDNELYIATTDKQHDQLVGNHHVDAQGGLSGYFSDISTVDSCKDGGSLDNTKYNEACQIAPYRPDGMHGEGDAMYKPHVDCFEIDRNRMQEVYGTQDFNAVISKCEANNQFGAGGGNQGYNPHISEMIDNGSLRYNESKSYSDISISASKHNNPNKLTNSIVAEQDYNDIMRDVKARSSDCVKNNTPHPSAEACKNGFSKENALHIDSNTGHATPLHMNNTVSETRGSSHYGSVDANSSDGFFNAKIDTPKQNDIPITPTQTINDGPKYGM